MLGPVESWLPAFNTSLIVVSGVFLVIGYVGIRRKRVVWHKRSMITASVFAALFLVVYITRALLLPTKFFPGEGLIRTVYLTILAVHTVIATLVGPLAFVTLRRAFRRDFERHRAIARVTLPMWLFTVVTGWIVYAMLHS